MNFTGYQKIADELHLNFLKIMNQRFGLQRCPSPYPIKFKPLLSLGGVGVDERGALEILLNDTLIIDPVDMLQLEQTVIHESGHILHLERNGFERNKPQIIPNKACCEPIGSIIADLAVLVYFSLKGNAD